LAAGTTRETGVFKVKLLTLDTPEHEKLLRRLLETRLSQINYLLNRITAIESPSLWEMSTKDRVLVARLLEQLK
jgi:hypothetical protein